MKKRLRYNNKSSSRIPAVADASRRHLTARSGLEVMLYELLQHALVQKERRNDLPELTPQRARELYEAYRRGEMADVQLMWDQLEERDETLFTVLHARLGALAEMPWTVNIDADLAEDMQPLAEQQQQLANKLLAAVENLPEALTHLGMADFRGVAALEVTGNAARMRWEVIEPWNLCRPVRRGPWYYNAEATSTPTRPEELDPAAVIIREAQPIDLPAMFLICAKYLSVHAWDAFLEVFGIPNIFLEMPPATPEGKAMEFDAIVQRLIGEGRGTVPSGAKFHTVETSKDNTQSFEARAKWCNEAIIQLATGGLLTVTTQSGSGTLAGNAHSDSFSRLCAASARSISAAINRQFLRPALEDAYPHAPILVRFELAPEPVDDRLQVAQLLGAVNSAGFRPSAETVSELMNFEVQPIQQPPTGANSAPVANTCNQYSHDPGCPDAKPDKMPDDADDELREAFAEADSMAHSGYTREQIWSATGIDYGPTPNGDSPTAAGTIRRARTHERTQQTPHSATARFAHRRAAAHKQALQDAEIENRKSTIENPAEAGEAPLSADELAALRALGGEINPAQIAADADYMTREMLAGLEEEDEELENRNYARESNGQFAETGAGQHSPRHGREGHTKPKREIKTSRPSAYPADSIGKVWADSDGNKYVRVLNKVESWEDAQNALSKKIDLAVEKNKSHIKGVPGKGVTAPGMKKEVFITKPGMKSMLSDAHTRRSADKKAHYTAAASADLLWSASAFKSEEPDTRTNNPNLRIHRRTAEMRIGKKSYQVLLTAKIYSTENNVDELHMVEILK